MVRYFRVLLDKRTISADLIDEQEDLQQTEYFMKMFRKSIIARFVIFGTDYELFLVKRMVSTKQELKKKLCNNYIYVKDISSANCKNINVMYNTYYQSCTKIMYNNLINK